MEPAIDIPPINNIDEEVISDNKFVEQCLYAMKIISDYANLSFEIPVTTYNNNYGIVCRSSFSAPHDEPGQKNVIIFWRNDEFNIVRFIGFDVDSERFKQSRTF